MDGTTPAPGSNDEGQRLKFLCSFSGSILPRPQDGKLRYVGGETRIVSLPHNITYDNLMSKMKELFENVAVLKYQQPDEDLDALVSVVNDDDVINMMEEYDKLGSADGFTRLRLFLFSHPEQDMDPLYFVEGDERDNERRYVDALNSLNELADFRKHPGELGSFDDMHTAEQYFSQMGLEGGGGTLGHRNMELPMAQMNLRHLTIPHLGSGQIQTQQPVGSQRFCEMEAPWSPAYYSPRQPEFPTSPSSARFRAPYDRFPPEDYGVVLVPTGDKVGGFPGNLLHQVGSSAYEGSSICDSCRMTFQRNQQVVYPDMSMWRPPCESPHLESPSVGNGNIQIPSSCTDCVLGREVYVLNPDGNVNPPYYCRDLNDPRPVYSETHSHERGWVPVHQPNPGAEESRHGYVTENGPSVPLGHIHHEDPRYARSGIDYGGQVFQDQAQVPHLPSVDERGVRYGNPAAYVYGTENSYVGPTGGLMPAQSPWWNVHSPIQVGGPSYETAVSSQMVNGSLSLPMGYVRGTVESSPRVRAGVENQNLWTESSQKVTAFNVSLMPDHSHIQAVKITPSSQTMENVQPVSFLASGVDYQNQNQTNKSVKVNGSREYEWTKEKNNGAESKETGVHEVQKCAFIKNDGAENECNNANVLKEQPDDQLDFLPELIASMKEATLQSLKEVKAKAQEDDSSLASERGFAGKEDFQNHKNGVDGNVDLEVEDDSDNVDSSKIELTKAEEEALDRGLQTIKNEDLEEIRELGSGTYGAVYHGKWKGSDVAIKRIKASCFAGRPSERERLIADFWKEALILSSLHHPNVVSFYGVVRDGPDGSLATVTEFMINGSLKQFLQKKDRTIDRRKRLIIAMDAAFGMEYLHGKNIVHFDLKCENLLVNMRDPHRPVCKIGDLGLSKVKQHTLVSGGVRGTLPWMAPELLSGKSNMVTEKIDVYSFGICMWELLTGDEPYTDMHCASIIGGIVNNTLRPQIPTWCDPEWKSLMESSWASDPAQRPSFSEIAQSPTSGLPRVLFRGLFKTYLPPSSSRWPEIDLSSEVSASPSKRVAHMCCHNFCSDFHPLAHALPELFPVDVGDMPGLLRLNPSNRPPPNKKSPPALRLRNEQPPPNPTSTPTLCGAGPLPFQTCLGRAASSALALCRRLALSAPPPPAK
ncbi:Protein kinase superfamily protein with octicosapeptide/Phox/Bem1p domain [Striga hermonthica]|uniref:Protein kinase superfamily protein with octicosapeptide/Phox/Bem1p domain n=1 Tax=Striga hermonthica TaxID=68872 RepID=A0A9N7N363_STRHE|nr:Protein kinase superfamily protein with octicosapeptide/Phox/Bem1p domain [Striga hermonthica]